MWVAVGSGTTSVVYSNDGITWIRLDSLYAQSAYLPFENSATDIIGNLTSPTMVGSIVYSSSIRKVGSYSAYFANTAGYYLPQNYLDYITPLSLQNPTAFTISFWMYPTSYDSSYYAIPIGFNDGNGARGLDFFASSIALYAAFATTTSPSFNYIYYSISDTLLAWTHVAFTFSIVNGSGVGTLYINGIAQSSATVQGIGGLSLGGTSGPMTHLTIGCQGAVGSAFGYAG
jgi:hypothetical protein